MFVSGEAIIINEEGSMILKETERQLHRAGRARTHAHELKEDVFKYLKYHHVASSS